MSTFVIVPGAWDTPAAMEPVIAPLGAAGHDAIVVRLPCGSADTTPQDYTDAVRTALPDDLTNVVLVGYSFGGFTASRVAMDHPDVPLVHVAAWNPPPVSLRRTDILTTVDTLLPPEAQRVMAASVGARSSRSLRTTGSFASSPRVSPTCWSPPHADPWLAGVGGRRVRTSRLPRSVRTVRRVRSAASGRHRSLGGLAQRASMDGSGCLDASRLAEQGCPLVPDGSRSTSRWYHRSCSSAPHTPRRFRGEVAPELKGNDDERLDERRPHAGAHDEGRTATGRGTGIRKVPTVGGATVHTVTTRCRMRTRTTTAPRSTRPSLHDTPKYPDASIYGRLRLYDPRPTSAPVPPCLLPAPQRGLQAAGHLRRRRPGRGAVPTQGRPPDDVR